MNKRIVWVLAAIVAVSALWMLKVEITYERNVRRGIPADFRISRHQVYMWKA